MAPRDYDRKKILAAAHRARSKGKRRRAVRLLRRVLRVEPGNVELLAQLAPLLARAGRDFDAWQSFRLAARTLQRDQQAGAAGAVLADAVRCLPRCFEAWREFARFERSRGNSARASEVLQEGRSHLAGRRRRPEAIALLREASEIDPQDFAVILDLATLLHREDQAEEAESMLEGLAASAPGRSRWVVRTRQCRLEPSLRHLWRWLAAGVALLREPEPRAASPAAARTKPLRAASPRA